MIQPRIYAVFLIVLIVSGSAYSQKTTEQLISYPGIGDTLDIRENNRFQIFPQYEDFQWAVFFTGPDSNVYAKIKLNEKGEQRIILTPYKDSGKLENRIIETKKRERNFPWQNAFFIGVGGGLPEGMRYELGLNLLYISLALNISRNNHWSDHLDEVLIGGTLKINVPLNVSKLTPYALFHVGTSNGPNLNIFGTSQTKYDSYKITYFGVMYPLRRALILRAEAGWADTKNYSDNPPYDVLLYSDSGFGFHLGIEIELKNPDKNGYSADF